MVIKPQLNFQLLLEKTPGQIFQVWHSTLVVLIFGGLIFALFAVFAQNRENYTRKIFNFLETAKIHTRQKKLKTPEFLGIFHPCDK